MSVSQHQLDQLRAQIAEGIKAEAARHGETAISQCSRAGKFWIMETGTLCDTQLRYQKKPKRSDFQVAAILDTESGVFVKGTVSAKGLRLAKGQPKAPPTIESYAVDSCGTVKGVGYAQKKRYVSLSSGLTSVRVSSYGEPGGAA